MYQYYSPEPRPVDNRARTTSRERGRMVVVVVGGEQDQWAFGIDSTIPLHIFPGRQTQANLVTTTTTKTQEHLVLIDECDVDDDDDQSRRP